MSRQHDDHQSSLAGSETRTLAHRPRTFDAGSRLGHFLRIARAERPAQGTLALQARGAEGPGEGRIAPFLRILRDRSA